MSSEDSTLQVSSSSNGYGATRSARSRSPASTVPGFPYAVVGSPGRTHSTPSALSTTPARSEASGNMSNALQQQNLLNTVSETHQEQHNMLNQQQQNVLNQTLVEANQQQHNVLNQTLVRQGLSDDEMEVLIQARVQLALNDLVRHNAELRMAAEAAVQSARTSSSAELAELNRQAMEAVVTARHESASARSEAALARAQNDMIRSEMGDQLRAQSTSAALCAEVQQQIFTEEQRQLQGENERLKAELERVRAERVASTGIAALRSSPPRMRPPRTPPRSQASSEEPPRPPTDPPTEHHTELVNSPRSEPCSLGNEPNSAQPASTQPTMLGPSQDSTNVTQLWTTVRDIQAMMQELMTANEGNTASSALEAAQPANSSAQSRGRSVEFNSGDREPANAGRPERSQSRNSARTADSESSGPPPLAESSPSSGSDRRRRRREPSSSSSGSSSGEEAEFRRHVAALNRKGAPWHRPGRRLGELSWLLQGEKEDNVYQTRNLSQVSFTKLPTSKAQLENWLPALVSSVSAIEDGENDVLAKMVIFSAEGGSGEGFREFLRSIPGLARFQKHLASIILKPEVLATASDEVAVEVTAYVKAEKRAGRGPKAAPLISIICSEYAVDGELDIGVNQTHLLNLRLAGTAVKDV